MAEEPKITFRCRPAASGMVELEIERADEPAMKLSIPGDYAVALSASLLGAAKVSGDAQPRPEQIKEGDPVPRMMGVIPTSVGISHRDKDDVSAVILQFGSARLAVQLSADQRSAMAKSLTDLTKVSARKR